MNVRSDNDRAPTDSCSLTAFLRSAASTELNTARRILVYRLGSLGDTIVALPSLNRVRSVFEHAHITLLTNAPVSAAAAPASLVLGKSLFHDDDLVYPVGTRDPAKLFALWCNIVRRRFDAVFHLTAARGPLSALRDYLFFKSCGISHVIGVPIRKSQQHSMLRPGEAIYRSEAELIASRLSPIGSPDVYDSKMWDLRLTEEELREGQHAVASLSSGPFIAASIGTKVDANNWGERNWASLLGKVSRRYPDLGLLMIGSEVERGISERLRECWGRRFVNACGTLMPRVSAAAVRSAHAFLGHDSGPMHLAAAVNVPVVAMFSARNLPGVWWPVGGERNRIVHRKTDCVGCGLEVCTHHAKKCILSITPDEVMRALESVLQAHIER